MTVTGRNSPCPCGSGKKYKLCCLGKDDSSFQLDSQRRHAARVAMPAYPPIRRTMRPEPGTPGFRTPPATKTYQILWDDDPLDEISNGVADDIKAGRFDDAEAGIKRLREEFPDVIDWLDRSALLADARGDHKLAADFYRRAIEFTYRHDQNDGFDEDGRDWMRDEIRRLDPNGPPPPLAPPAATTS